MTQTKLDEIKAHMRMAANPPPHLSAESVWEDYWQAAGEEYVPALVAEVDLLRSIVEDFLDCGIEFEDSRLQWVTMQVDRSTLRAAKEAMRDTSAKKEG